MVVRHGLILRGRQKVRVVLTAVVGCRMLESFVDVSFLAVVLALANAAARTKARGNIDAEPVADSSEASTRARNEPISPLPRFCRPDCCRSSIRADVTAFLRSSAQRLSYPRSSVMWRRHTCDRALRGREACRPVASPGRCYPS